MLGLLVPGVGMGAGGTAVVNAARMAYTVPPCRLNYTAPEERLECTVPKMPASFGVPE